MNDIEPYMHHKMNQLAKLMLRSEAMDTIACNMSVHIFERERHNTSLLERDIQKSSGYSCREVLIQTLNVPMYI